MDLADRDRDRDRDSDDALSVDPILVQDTLDAACQQLRRALELVRLAQERPCDAHTAAVTRATLAVAHATIAVSSLLLAHVDAPAHLPTPDAAPAPVPLSACRSTTATAPVIRRPVTGRRAG